MKLINFYEDVCNPWHFFPGLTRVTTLEGINHIRIVGLFSHIHCIKFHKLAHQVAGRKKRNRLGQNVLHSSNKCRVSKTEQFNKNPFHYGFYGARQRMFRPTLIFPNFYNFQELSAVLCFLPQNVI